MIEINGVPFTDEEWTKATAMAERFMKASKDDNRKIFGAALGICAEGLLAESEGEFTPADVVTMIAGAMREANRSVTFVFTDPTVTIQ